MDQKACKELDGNSDETTVTPNGKKRCTQQVWEQGGKKFQTEDTWDEWENKQVFLHQQEIT